MSVASLANRLLSPSFTTAAEWAGTVLGLVGAWLVAVHTSISPYGWVAFTVANVATILFAIGIRRWGLLVQQAGFMGSSLLGLYRSGLF